MTVVIVIVIVIYLVAHFKENAATSSPQQRHRCPIFRVSTEGRGEAHGPSIARVEQCRVTNPINFSRVWSEACKARHCGQLSAMSASDANDEDTQHLIASFVTSERAGTPLTDAQQDAAANARCNQGTE